MSNDKTTLADAQPGGRVRLGDQPWPEIDAILADAYSAGATGLPFEGIARRHAVRAAVAALSAQPSPGGQDASFPWENFPAYLIDKCEGDTISEEGLQQALAAMAKDERYCLAARQPVGEAIGEIVYSGEGGLQIEFYDGKPLAPMKLYAAPPAQGMDLDELRRAFCVVNVVGQIDGHDVVRRNSVLDVIDTRRQRLTERQAEQP